MSKLGRWLYALFFELGELADAFSRWNAGFKARRLERQKKR